MAPGDTLIIKPQLRGAAVHGVMIVRVLMGTMLMDTPINLQTA